MSFVFVITNIWLCKARPPRVECMRVKVERVGMFVFGFSFIGFFKAFVPKAPLTLWGLGRKPTFWRMLFGFVSPWIESIMRDRSSGARDAEQPLYLTGGDQWLWMNI